MSTGASSASGAGGRSRRPGGSARPGGDQVVDRDGLGRGERADLGDRDAVDRDDDALARPGPPHDGGDVVPELPDAHAFHGVSVRRP